jgi:uncharacterized protein YyaL (SSP411 family)
MAHAYTNKLALETSPYLLQHAHNPVNWYPWGEEALQQAKTDNKVILVSIGYSACHWCHVMERESFEDVQTAEIMNEHFINIKIDREERPDIDNIYMDAVQYLTGSGGWPLNVFLTPDAQPFYGGTYYPPTNAYNRPSWKEVLAGVAQAWQQQKEAVLSRAGQLTQHVESAGNFAVTINTTVSVTAEELIAQQKEILHTVMRTADTQWGGFGKAPKFPQTATIRYLLQYHYYTADIQALQQALLSVNKMLQGGIYDHIGGGLARYSTDNEWLAPHFEKMLYDNALLLQLLADVYQVTRDEHYKQAAESIINFLKNELAHPSGGFYAALDADSEGIEGKYYVWQKQAVEEILGTDAGLFCQLFDITDSGNWEGENIPRLLVPLKEFALQQQLNEPDLHNTINKCIAKLLQARQQRVRPGLDDKIIVSWNALTITALAKTARVFKNDEYAALAKLNYQFICKHCKAENEYALQHTWKNGQAKHPGFLDDYAFLTEAAIALYELTFEEQFLQQSLGYCRYAIDNFSDATGLFFYYTSSQQQDVIVRKKEIYDGATPSANAIMAANLQKLGILFDIPDWQQRATAMLAALNQAITKYPVSFSNWACLLLQQVRSVNEIAFAGTKAAASADTFLSNHYIPGKIVAVLNTINHQIPFLNDKPVNNVLSIYLCKKQACAAPVKNEQQLISLINTIDKF